MAATPKNALSDNSNKPVAQPNKIINKNHHTIFKTFFLYFFLKIIKKGAEAPKYVLAGLAAPWLQYGYRNLFHF